MVSELEGEKKDLLDRAKGVQKRIDAALGEVRRMVVERSTQLELVPLSESLAGEEASTEAQEETDPTEG